MALESSLQGLQVWFRPRPDQRLGRGATKSQSPDKLPWANAEYTIGSMVVASLKLGPWCVM
jgi:hypothetical protein